MKRPSLGAQQRMRLAFAALALGQLALAACAEHIVAPVVPTEAAVTTPIHSIVVRDALERLAPSLADGRQGAVLSQVLVQLRGCLEAGKLSDAALNLALARKSLLAARVTEDGTMAADLTAIELALDSAGEALNAALAGRATHSR